MRPWRQASLQGRLLWSVLGVVASLWCLTLVLTWMDAHHELDELLDGHLAQAAALLVGQEAHEGRVEHSDADDADDDALLALLETPQLHPYAQRVAFQVWRGEQLLRRSAQAPAQAMSGRSSGFETVSLDGEDWRLFATPGTRPGVRVLVAEREAARDEILWAVLRGMLGPLLLGLPLIGVAAALAIRQGLAPLRQLVQALTLRAPAALTPLQAPEPLPAEVAPLVAALNQLLARVAALLETERRFTADAAHELRTPIAAIRTQAQVALGAGHDDAGRRHALLATLAGCDRASHLVQQLLTLARLEGAAHRDAAPGPAVDLARLAQREAANLALAALDRQQSLSLEASGVCPVAGDEALLGVLLRNLLDNALRYSPPGASIAVAVQVQAASVLLSVEDSGPGLSEAEQARLGERFFRVLGNGADGSGLGWSIVRRIAAVHHATLVVGRSATLGGLAVSLRFARVASPGAEPAANAPPLG